MPIVTNEPKFHPVHTVLAYAIRYGLPGAGWTVLGAAATFVVSMIVGIIVDAIRGKIQTMPFGYTVLHGFIVTVIIAAIVFGTIFAYQWADAHVKQVNQAKRRGF